MMKAIANALASAGLGLCALAALPAAQADDPFTVTGIRIDETADTAAEAQRRALEAGQVRAAEVLIERLTLPEDRVPAPLEIIEEGSLEAVTLEEADPLEDPEAVGGPEPRGSEIPSRLPVIDAGMAAELVAGFDIANERRSPTRYIGELTVTFDRRAVGDFLRHHDIPFVQSQARPILVVPVLQSDTGSVVWAGPWYEAWRTERFAHALTPFIGLGTRFEESAQDGPAGTPGEGGEEAYVPPAQRMAEQSPSTPLGRRLLSTADAQSLDEAVLRELASLYGVDKVAVIAARSGAGAVRAGGALVEFTEEGMEASPIPTIAVPGGFEDAAARIVEMHELAWKRESIVRDGEQTTMEIIVLYRGIRDWHALQTAVAGASLIENARLDALSPGGAVMTLAYRGGIEQVRAELRSRGAHLEDNPDLGWTVRSTR